MMFNKEKFMNMIVNPWEMGEEVTSTSIPAFTQGKFIVLRLAPPRGKTVREGLVATMGMISYIADDGTEKVLIEVSQNTNGYSVEFPLGKRGIMATKYRGPKSWYSFVNNETGKRYQIGKNDPVTKINSKCTLEAAEEYLSNNVKDWNNLDVTSKEDAIDEYFGDMFMYGLAKDFNLDVEKDDSLVPAVGMISDFYRRYTPPKEGERYGNVIVTKYAPSQGKDNLSGDNKVVDTEIAATIYEGLTTRDDSASSFDPTKIVENSEKSDVI